MDNMYKQALEETQKGWLSRKTDAKGHEIFCYTKPCFFNQHWNHITKSHRGALYYQGKPVNRPFTKIFNVGEVPETSHEAVSMLLETEEYEIFDKVNGHLFILSTFVDDDGEQHVVMSTKGSLPNPDNDLLNADIELFYEKYAEAFDRMLDAEVFRNMTVMFEVLADYDQHTLYNSQIERYSPDGSNVMVMLDAYMWLDEHLERGVEKGWYPVDYGTLRMMSEFASVPLANRYSRFLIEQNPNWHEEMMSDQGIEGYVIHFPMIDFRCKVKTREYWALRFKKDLQPQNIIHKYRSGGADRIRLKLPEEVSDQILDAIKHHLFKWWTDVHVDVGAIPAEAYGWDRKSIYMSDRLTSQQRHYLFSVMNDKVHTRDSLVDKIGVAEREKFSDYMLDNDILDAELQGIIDAL